MNLRVAISMGDCNGIGPEIILKTLDQITAAGATPIVIGHENIFNFYADSLGLVKPDSVSLDKAEHIEDGMVNFFNIKELDSVYPEPGTFSEQAGAAAMKAVDIGADLCMEKQAHALITAPISKEAVNKAGYRIPGHTEFLAGKTGTEHFMMILVHKKLRVGLVSIHIPVSKVAGEITTEAVLKKIRVMTKALHNDFNIGEPRIAVLGLNPHAGDGGVIGREEIDIITPAVTQAKKEHLNVSGPYPADGFFGNRRFDEYDGVLAMYHDQGLVPFKTLSFGRGVNVTAGLPIIRTSPDHGTAFDIAGENKADPSSFIEAALLAIKLGKNRFQEKTHHV